MGEMKGKLDAGEKELRWREQTTEKEGDDSKSE